jgi:hypothetical protein
MSSLTILGDTSGSILLQAPAVAGSTTLTLPATSGTVGLSGPAFSASSSTYTSISNGTFTLVVLNTEQFDTASCFNNTGSTVGSVPAYAFLPNVAGYYLITGTVADNNSGTPTRMIGRIYKNGSSYLYTGGDQVTGYVSSFSSVIYLNGSTDYIQLYQYIAAGGPYSEGMMTGCFLRGA